jgi:glycosyltransferase involved in cell wall biosynthesis
LIDIILFLGKIPRMIFNVLLTIYLMVAVVIRTAWFQWQNSRMPAPERDPSDSQHFDVICFSHVPWTHIWQRNHHTMARVARNHKVLYVQTTSIAYIHWFVKLWPKSLKEYQTWYPDVTLLYPILFPGQSKIPLVGVINRWILSTEIKWHERKMGMRNTVLWFYYPAAVNVLEKFDPAAIVYDIQDEYTAFNWSPPDISQRERDLLAQADIIFGGTYALYEQKKIGFRGRAYFYPCAVEFGHYFNAAPVDYLNGLLESDLPENDKSELRQVLESAKSESLETISRDVHQFQNHGEAMPNDITKTVSEKYLKNANVAPRLQEPARFKNFGRPRLVYVGLIDKRIDGDLLCHIAQAEPDWEIIMVGPVDVRLFNQQAVERAAPNIHFVGSVPYARLPQFLAFADVYLMPWKVNELTRHINPTKTLEYMAAGRPIVSIALPDLERLFTDSVALARTCDEFLKACRDALAGRMAGNVIKGLARAQSFSWDRIVAEMEGHVMGAIRDREKILR